VSGRKSLWSLKRTFGAVATDSPQSSQTGTGQRLNSEGLFLLLVCLVIAFLMVGQLWGTGFTCDDDLYTATAWQRTGTGAQGWSGVWQASKDIAVFTGRFYQLFAYTLTQIPYHLGSFDTVNAFRIAGLLFAFGSYAAMLASVTRVFSFAMYCSILAAGLIETKYDYNPFHAFPLWFTVGAGFLFLAILMFNEGLLRGKYLLIYGGAAAYFGTMMFYEPFIFYGIVFFALALIHDATLPKTSFLAAARAFRRIWPFSASAVLYVALYWGFRYWHPGTYAGTAVSLASFRRVMSTIIGFSGSGLNFRGILPISPRVSVLSVVAALLVVSAAFVTMRRPAYLPLRPLPIASLAALCMFLPNIQYGFTERYRQWLSSYGNFYLGSFYSAFAEAVVIAALSIWIARQAARVRLAAITAAVISTFLGLATYSNVRETLAVYQVHRDTRKIWDLVEASIHTTGGPKQASILIAPSLLNTLLIRPSTYDYWSFYFSDKFQRSVRVIASPAEFSRLTATARRGPVFAFMCRYFPGIDAGLFAFGPLDINTWLQGGHLVVQPVQAGVLGEGGDLSVVDETAERAVDRIPHRTARWFVLEGQPVNLNGLALRR
jgi:hypothetical protein